MATTKNSELDELILSCFPDVAVDKAVARSIGTGERAIPAFVRDWLVSRYSADGHLDVQRIHQFLAEHLPDKQQREFLRHRLLQGEELVILDGYEVKVDLRKGEYDLRVPSLDVFDARIPHRIVDENPLLLSGPLWGAGRLQYRRRQEGGEIWLVDFKPMQTARVDLAYYIEQRRAFTLQQWMSMLVRSMGYEPAEYTPAQTRWLLARLALLVQPRLNLIELAPKGTGKSYVFSQVSKYAWLISGGVVTRAKLFYDMHIKAPGVITCYDAVILDEVQTLRLAEEGEILGALKGFLESGEFRVMGFSGNSEASFALLANIPIGADGRPLHEGRAGSSLFETLPSWLHGKDATALIDRFHGLIPGWELPRIQKQHLAAGVGLRADYLSEVLHELRQRDEYMDFVTSHTIADGDLRDIKAVQRIAAAYVRLLFPDLRLSLQEFEHYCLAPAKFMRQLVRDQLAAMDSEYSPHLARISAQP
ncbi:MAG: BREX system Lon protease-like protein BrxL [Armatimonadetes bacterium]|nr:BREX system Lon protease-like protein BrxL [Armatimonadota bacterium]